MTGASLLATSFVLAVPDARATARWWVETMGFEIWLEPEGWAFLRRGACGLRLGSCPDAIDPRNLGDHQYFAYVEIDDVDRYHAEIVAKGADLLFAPTTQPWGMREMGVRTPDGHRLMFATAMLR
jgi:catechol 2,3-dioxygenase-like lactoylglutathione lyase family enzyme